MTGISKSQVSRLCAEIDERVGAFLDRPIEGDWPYLWIDATYVKVREGGRIVSVAVAWLDTDGRRTARHAVAFAAALLPMSLAPSFIGMAGWPHLAVASLLGAGFVALAIRFLLSPSSRRARALFRGSLAYLPLLWASLIAERFM